MPGRIDIRRGGRKIGHAHHRINFLIAMVFLLSLAIGAKMLYLQVFKYDYYLAEASGLHTLNTKIEPERGKIYLTDKSKNDELYPLATNKEYISIFAVPRDLKEPNRVIDKLYEFFKADDLTAEAEKIIAKEEAEKLATAVKANPEDADNIKNAHRAQLADTYYQELRQQRKLSLIEQKKQTWSQDLLVKLTQAGDPYELLQKKVEADLAKQFHLSLISDYWQNGTVKIDDLKIENNKIYQEENGQQTVMDYPGMGYQSEYYRYYLDNSLACHILGYTDNEKVEQDGELGRHGHYGLEGFFDDELFGKYGTVQTEKGAGGVMIVMDRTTDAKKNGDDLVLTIDRSIQYYASSLVEKAVKAYSADSATIIIMEPQTGAIIAMASYPGFDPNNYNLVTDSSLLNNPAIFDAYEPGSVFKPLTMASALNEGKVEPNTTYVDKGQIMIEGWPKPISNSDFSSKGGHGVTTMNQVLEKSLNTGAIWSMKTIGSQTFAEYVINFGFGEKTGIELEGEAKGNIANLKVKKIKEINAATASFGQGISVTPIQMITAFTVLANGGKLVKPNIVKAIRQGDGNVMSTPIMEPKQVISPEASSKITGMLINVVENGSAYRNIRLPGYYIAGKTGTAQISNNKGWLEGVYNHTFVGFAPADNPRFVILVRVAKPRGFEYAESTAVPTARQMNEFILNYWQVPKNRQ